LTPLLQLLGSTQSDCFLINTTYAQRGWKVHQIDVKSAFLNGLFAKQFLLSIESAARKTIVVDKATQEKFRP